MIGRTLSHYRITAKLGEGGMGTVWLAEDTLLGRPVALKLLAAQLANSEAARQRFIREARAASRLEHCGIATVYEAGEADGEVFIAYQFIEGETLARRLEKGPLPLPDLLRLARGTAEALAHAHGRDVLHRDLTAGNIMLRSDCAPVIVDFGLARSRGDVTLTNTGTTLGTAPYLAPEQWRGESGDARTDLWSLGVVLYYAATGQQPFTGDTQEAVMYRVLNDEPTKPTKLRAELPAKFERLVLRLTEKDARDRLASAAELAAAMQAFESANLQAAAPAPVSGETPAARLRRWWRRQQRRRLGPAHFAGLIVAIAALALSVWFAAQRGWLPGGPKAPEVVAVIPFTNTSTDPEEVSYLGEGLGDELVNKLGQASGYRVLPWATTRTFAGTTRKFPDIARQLHVDALLAGTFRVEEARVRVTASLVDGRTGVQRWSESFDDPLDHLMTLQVDIATSVASELKGHLDPSENLALARKPSTNNEAYEAYLQGATYLQSDDFASRSLARPFFDRAIELDVKLAKAYVGRGAAQLDEHFRGTGGGLELIRQARQDFTRALELEPGLGRAELGLITVNFEIGRPEEALKIAARLAARGDDDIEGLNARGFACMYSGFAASAVPLFDRVLQLDPSNQQASWFRVVSLTWADEFVPALSAGKEYIRRFGEDPEIYLWMAVSAAILNSDQEAEAFFDRSLTIFGDDSSDLYSVLFSTAYYLRRNMSKQSTTLIRHWLPILRARAQQAPDNFRLSSTLIGLEWFARDSTQARRHVVEWIDQLRKNSDFAGVSLQFHGISYAGNLTDLERAIAGISGRDLGSLFLCLAHFWDDGLSIGPRSRTLLDSQLFQAFKSAVRARRDELGRRYLPLVALHGKGPESPDPPSRRPAP